jgi:predicted dehydrogenase
MKSLVVGMGIGQLYKSVLTQLDYEVCTVDTDINKNADFPSIEPAILLHGSFDTVHICTPNFTHLELAVKLAPISKIVFIEKPGLIDRNEWAKLCKRFPRTRFMMVKNNMWRDNIAELQQKASLAKNVDIEWIRRNCIPSPGSWFTTRKLAFGGVSRDLMPHLLSLYIALNPNWRIDSLNGVASIQNWLLEDIESTEYGTVNPNGTYDVDDLCNIHFSNKWSLRANWRTMDTERSAITFINQDNSRDVFELGWCPEEAYLNMIKDAITNLNNDEYWKVQLEIDLWIHERIENL